MKFYLAENMPAEDAENSLVNSGDEVYTEIGEEEVPMANLATNSRGDGMIFAGAGIVLAVILALITGYVSFGAPVEGKKATHNRRKM